MLYDTLSRIRMQAQNSNSTAVQFRVLQPLLQDLGWDTADPTHIDFSSGAADVVLSIPCGEHGVHTGRAEPRPVVQIKITSAPAELPRAAEALLAAAIRDGVDLCVATTGRAWTLYLPKPAQDVEQCRFAEWDLQTDAVAHLADQLETLLSRDALIQQRSQRAAEHALTSRLNAERVEAALPQVWQRMLAGPDSFLVEYVQDEVRKQTGLHASPDQVARVVRESAARERVQPPQPPPTQQRQRVEEERRAPSAPPPVKPVQIPPKRPRSADPGVGSHGKRSWIGKSVAGMRLWGREHSINRWKDVWLLVASQVYERHPDDFERALRMRGKVRQYVARSPSDLAHPAQIAHSNYYVETQFNADDCVRKAEEILELFGYQREDLEISDDAG